MRVGVHCVASCITSLLQLDLHNSQSIFESMIRCSKDETLQENLLKVTCENIKSLTNSVVIMRKSSNKIKMLGIYLYSHSIL